MEALHSDVHRDDMEPLQQEDVAALERLVVTLACSGAGSMPSVQLLSMQFSEHLTHVLGSMESGQIRDAGTVRACMP